MLDRQAVVFLWMTANGDKQHMIQIQGFACILRKDQMPKMWRVERPAENTDISHVNLTILAHDYQ